MRGAITIAAALAMAVAVALAACGGVTNQTVTPGQVTTTPSAAALPSATPTATAPSSGGQGGGGGTAAQGKAIYAANCAGCHGATGTGGIGPNITAITDLTRVQQQVTGGGAAGPDPTPGTGGVVMPAFKGKLTPAEITAVSKYVAGGFKG